jgi:capsular polysaccharide transport system permease protein
MTRAAAHRTPTSSRDLRRARARRLLARFALWVGIPTLLGIGYYGCWASSQYESVAVVTVQSSEGSVTGLDALSAILPPSGSGHDVLLVREYILSRAMLAVLVGEHGLADHYQRSGADWWSRLAHDASSEDIYDYYLDKVKVSHDSSARTLTLRVRAFSAETAEQFANAIITSSEEVVNALSERARADRMKLAEAEVAKSEARMARARETLLRMQAEGSEFDPTQTASAVLAIRTQLEAELAKARAELDALVAVMHRDTPKVIEQRQRVRSLERQVAAQNRKLAPGDEGGLNESIFQFEPALIEKELAQRTFEAALQSLELARIEAAGQHRYLVTIAPPSRPDAPTHPRRGWAVAAVFVTALALMGVFSLLGAAVREHAKL